MLVVCVCFGLLVSKFVRVFVVDVFMRACFLVADVFLRVSFCVDSIVFPSVFVMYCMCFASDPKTPKIKSTCTEPSLASRKQAGRTQPTPTM